MLEMSEDWQSTTLNRLTRFVVYVGRGTAWVAVEVIRKLSLVVFV